jgi:hypothetical protein
MAMSATGRGLLLGVANTLVTATALAVAEREPGLLVMVAMFAIIPGALAGFALGAIAGRLQAHRAIRVAALLLPAVGVVVGLGVRFGATSFIVPACIPTGIAVLLLERSTRVQVPEAVVAHARSNRGRTMASIRSGAPILLGVVAMLVALWRYESTRGLKVSVHNAGSRPLSSMVVEVTGNSYRLGELQPGDTRSVYVRPRSESHVELSFAGHDGQLKRLNAGGYFEPRDTGTIAVDVTADSVRVTEQNVRSGF